MADSKIDISPALPGGDSIDAEVLTVGPNTVKRERDQIAGAGADDIAVVTDAAPSASDHGLVVRNIPSGTQAVSGPLTDAQLRATPVPITGTITASDASVGAVGAAAPGFSQQNGGPDAAGNLQPHRVYDTDSGAGAEYTLGVQLRKSASGGSVELGTAADPVRVDPTGSTTQPVSAAALPLPTGAATEATLATRAADRTTAVAPLSARLSDGAAFYKATTPADTQPISAASLPLPAGAATSANQASEIALLTTIDADTSSLDVALSTRAADTTITARLGVLGQAAMAGSTPVVIASDQSTIPVSAASLPLPTGAATAANQVTGNTSLASIDGKTPALVSGRVPVDGSGVTQPISAVSLPLPTGAATEATLSTRAASAQFPVALVAGRLDTNTGAWLGSTAPTVGQKTGANSLPVVPASDYVQIVAPQTTATGAPAGVTVSTSAVLLVASNVNRRSVIVTNNGSTNIFLGTSGSVTASGAAMGIKVAPNGVYSDAGDGLWTGALHAIGDGASGSQNVSVWERTA